LKDIDYNINQVELIINFRNKEFDGEIYHCLVDVKLKYGIQCAEGDLVIEKKFNQEINQIIRWTEYDIEFLHNEVNNICNCNLGEKKDYYGVSLMEQEFEALCFIYENDYEYERGLAKEKETFILLFVSVGINSKGPTIKLVVTRTDLLRWVNEIKHKFFLD